MSLTLKLFSLVTRTAAKPIGNYIKQQAREHERFRKICVSLAQGVHRIDMRLRLGLLQDPAVIEKQIKKEAQEAEDRRLRAQNRPPSTTPTVRTEEQIKADEEADKRERKFAEGKVKVDEKRKERRFIRPLSEAKAIDSGANFLSETFVFGVALGLLLFENFRSRRKESNRRDVVKERLDKLEDDVLQAQQEKELLEEELADMRSKFQALPFPQPSPPAPPQKKRPKPVQDHTEEGSVSHFDEGSQSRHATPGAIEHNDQPSSNATATTLKAVASLEQQPVRKEASQGGRNSSTKS